MLVRSASWVDGLGAKRKASTEKADGPEFIVTRTFFDRYFEKPMPESTFHDKVSGGVILSWPHLRGRYLLNASLRNMHLPTVSQLPSVGELTTEDLIRLAFTTMDEDLFPAPACLVEAGALSFEQMKHIQMLGRRHQEKLESLDHHVLKLNDFQGALDAARMVGDELLDNHLP